MEPINIIFVLTVLSVLAVVIVICETIEVWVQETDSRKQERLCERGAWDYDDEVQKEAYIASLQRPAWDGIFEAQQRAYRNAE